MFKACSRCGRIHDIDFKCKKNVNYKRYNYDSLRNSNKWKLKSKQIREDSNNLCAVCLDNNKYTYDDLDVHHIIKIKDDEQLLLDDYNLIALCKYHHKQADNGKLGIDYLKKLVERRYKDGF